MEGSDDKAVWKSQGEGMNFVGVKVRDGMVREK